jgi:tungstate transport system substrate-binding protein
MQRNHIIWIVTPILIAIVSVAGTLYYAIGNPRRKLIISTTTSLYDTGLFDTIEDQFEEKYPIDLYVISVGTGLAISHAERGDADLILVHAPQKELAFLESGSGTARKIIAYNFFAIAGPESDPAEIMDLSPNQAFHEVTTLGLTQKRRGCGLTLT